jgi:hypothetical protein
MPAEHWKQEPEDQDFPAAESYLSLLVGPDAAAKLVKAMRKRRKVVFYAAKDLLRASRLPLLKSDDTEVAGDLKKVKPCCLRCSWSKATHCGSPTATTGYAPAITSTRRRRSPAESLPARNSPVGRFEVGGGTVR